MYNDIKGHYSVRRNVYDLLFRWLRILKRQAGFAVELTHGALSDDVKNFPNHADVTVCQLQGSGDDQLVQSLTYALANTPDITNVGQVRKSALPAPIRQIHHAPGLGPFLCRMVGQFCYVIQIFCKRQ